MHIPIHLYQNCDFEPFDSLKNLLFMKPGVGLPYVQGLIPYPGPEPDESVSSSFGSLKNLLFMKPGIGLPYVQGLMPYPGPEPDESMFSHHISLRYILILYCHLCLGLTSGSYFQN